MHKEISRIRKFPFDDGTYVIFEEYRTVSGRYLFSDVYYKDIKESSYLGQYNELDEPNTWVKKNGNYIIIYEYEIGQTNLVKNIINLYNIEEDTDIFSSFKSLLDIFNKNSNLLKLKDNLEKKKTKSINRRKAYTSRSKKLYQNVTNYEITEEKEIIIFDNINRTDYNQPTKGIYDYSKTFKK